MNYLLSIDSTTIGKYGERSMINCLSFGRYLHSKLQNTIGTSLSFLNCLCCGCDDGAAVKLESGWQGESILVNGGERREGH